jgi:hypothetical protein
VTRCDTPEKHEDASSCFCHLILQIFRQSRRPSPNSKLFYAGWEHALQKLCKRQSAKLFSSLQPKMLWDGLRIVGIVQTLLCLPQRKDLAGEKASWRGLIIAVVEQHQVPIAFFKTVAHSRRAAEAKIFQTLRIFDRRCAHLLASPTLVSGRGAAKPREAWKRKITHSLVERICNKRSLRETHRPFFPCGARKE